MAASEVAVRVVRVLDPHVHGVAASAKALPLGGSEALHVADHRDHDRQHAHPEHHHRLAGGVERRPAPEVVNHDAGGDER